MNAEHAVNVEVDDLMRLLPEVENEYVQERAADVKDVGTRVLKNLGPGPQEVFDSIPPGSCCAEDLLPSDTLNMDRACVDRIVTEQGGSTSHMAILARALGIPAVSGIANACQEIPTGSDVLVDGTGGAVMLNAAGGRRDEFVDAREQYDQDHLEVSREEDLECVTLDGTHIRLLGNIGRSVEAGEICRRHLQDLARQMLRTDSSQKDALLMEQLRDMVVSHSEIGAR